MGNNQIYIYYLQVMENKLEQLLNSLIEKGWFPRWEREPIYMLSSKKLYIPDTMEVNRSLRDLVSKESWLWQFVCENGMVNANDTPEENAINYWRYNKKDLTEWWYMRNYQYRVIESALKDESELEQFLLQNIKVWNI